MKNGIEFAGKHSYYDFGAVVTKRKISVPKKKRVTESVPYSSTVYDFSAIYGEKVYEQRQLQYVFSISDGDSDVLQKRLADFVNWLYPSGKDKLYDERIKDSYFMAECITLEIEESPFVALVTATFEAEPEQYPITPEQPYEPSSYPDLDGDGAVTAADAALILSAASATGAGNASGLTPQQEVLADVDRDGTITAADAAIVTEFATAVGAGSYPDTPEGWTAFMNAKTLQEEGKL